MNTPSITNTYLFFSTFDPVFISSLIQHLYSLPSSIIRKQEPQKKYNDEFSEKAMLSTVQTKFREV